MEHDVARLTRCLLDSQNQVKGLVRERDHLSKVLAVARGSSATRAPPVGTSPAGAGPPAPSTVPRSGSSKASSGSKSGAGPPPPKRGLVPRPRLSPIRHKRNPQRRGGVPRRSPPRIPGNYPAIGLRTPFDSLTIRSLYRRLLRRPRDHGLPLRALSLLPRGKVDHALLVPRFR